MVLTNGKGRRTHTLSVCTHMCDYVENKSAKGILSRTYTYEKYKPPIEKKDKGYEQAAEKKSNSRWSRTVQKVVPPPD